MYETLCAILCHLHNLNTWKTLIEECYFLNSTNSTKSRKASHIHSEGWSEDTGISETQNRQTRGGSSFLTENIPSIVKLSVAYIFIKSKLWSFSFNASFFLSIFLINERSKKSVIFTFKLNMPIFMLHLDLLNFLLLGYQKTIVAIFWDFLLI